MSLISVHAPLPISIREAARAWSARVPRVVKLVAASAMLLIAADQLWLALQSPAQTIRGRLASAAEETAGLSWKTPPEQVNIAVARYFPGQAVRVDSTRFPVEVSVVLAGLDRGTCIEARDVAQRIEGNVVVALDGYRSADECRARNAMTWRIMP